MPSECRALLGAAGLPMPHGNGRAACCSGSCPVCNWNSLTDIDKRWKRTDAFKRQSVEAIATRLETTGYLDRAAIDQLLKRYPARKVEASTASPRKDNGGLE
jgi:hypothetical protein